MGAVDAEPGFAKVERMDESMEAYANIMATDKPNPRGPGYVRLYLLASVVFLCSTMNGTLVSEVSGFLASIVPRSNIE